MVQQKLEIGKWYKKLTTHNDEKKFCIYKIINYNTKRKAYYVIHYCAYNLKNEKNPRKEYTTQAFSNYETYIEITKEEAFLEIL